MTPHDVVLLSQPYPGGVFHLVTFDYTGRPNNWGHEIDGNTAVPADAIAAAARGGFAVNQLRFASGYRVTV